MENLSDTLLNLFFQIRYENYIDIEENIWNLYPKLKELGYENPVRIAFCSEEKSKNLLKTQPIYMIRKENKNIFILLGYFFVSLTFGKITKEDFINEYNKVKLYNFVKNNKIIRIGEQVDLFFDKDQNIFDMINIFNKEIDNDIKYDTQVVFTKNENNKKNFDIKSKIILKNNQVITVDNIDKKGSFFTIDTFMDKKEECEKIDIEDIKSINSDLFDIINRNFKEFFKNEL